MNEEEERAYHINKRPDRTYLSKSFPHSLTGEKLRIASKVVDGEEGLRFATVKSETTLRVTPMGRSEIKAVFFEDDRQIRTLTLQRFNAGTGASEREHFTFVGSEIETLLEFILGIKAVALDEPNKLRLSDDQLRHIILDDAQARRVFLEDDGLLLQIAQSEELKRDLVATGYRRKQLDRFQKLLDDPAYFASERERATTTPEGLWQAFFEENTWIFGYGLSYQFMTGLDDKKLEQVVRGFDVTGSGKRADGLMKTQARVNTLCFVEIKRHDDPLLAKNPYRAEAWQPSDAVSGGVAQGQVTVQAAVERIGRKLTPTDSKGDPTGESLFNIEPRSFLVVGKLDEFVTEHGVNEAKVRSFELYRRNVRKPEIITFDELLCRARFIVEHDATPDAEA